MVNSIECRPVAPNCKYLFNAMTPGVRDPSQVPDRDDEISRVGVVSELLDSRWDCESKAHGEGVATKVSDGTVNEARPSFFTASVTASGSPRW